MRPIVIMRGMSTSSMAATATATSIRAIVISSGALEADSSLIF